MKNEASQRFRDFLMFFMVMDLAAKNDTPWSFTLFAVTYVIITCVDMHEQFVNRKKLN